MAESYSKQVSALQLKLDKQVSRKTADKVLFAITAEMQHDMDDYPPHSWRNERPGNKGRWYVRGTGTKTEKKTYRTSQNFGQGWDRRKLSNVRYILENQTTYGGYLMGNVQVGWAKEVGWKHAKTVLDANSTKYLKLAQRTIARINKA